jgi:hypothetical protein
MPSDVAKRAVNWRQGLLRIWLVGAVIWTGGVAVTQFYYLNAYIKICVAACIATPERPFDQCWQGMVRLIGYEEETRLKMWALISFGGAALSLIIGALTLWTAAWILRGFKPRT